ncbi:hypothetical protein ACWF94_21805 [Streptomyces sp. NPDC055078]
METRRDRRTDLITGECDMWAHDLPKLRHAELIQQATDYRLARLARQARQERRAARRSAREREDGVKGDDDRFVRAA